MKYCKPELSFFIFTSYERSECFIFGVKRKMLHSRMKWSCFIVRRFLWSILRRCRKIWSASCDAWSGTACHEAKPDGFIPPFFLLSKMLLGDCLHFIQAIPHFCKKKIAEEEGFEPSIILLVKSRLKRCFIPPFERKFLKFQHYMALLSAWRKSTINGEIRRFFTTKWGRMGTPIVALNQPRNSRNPPWIAENHFDTII